MAITKTKKEGIIEKLQDISKNAKTIVFVNFNGVSSEEINTLRGVCDSEDVSYIVAKKTLIKKALESAKFEGDFPTLEGEIALAYSDDSLAPARVIGQQGKALDNRMQIVGGVYENSYVLREKMQAIADIPPLNVLYAQLLMVIRGPIQGLATSLGQIAEKK